MTEPKRYYGKYRGLVIGNDDMAGRGRILALVAEVTGTTPTIWAEPCVPLAGINAGILALPAIGSSVWIEYEKGDVNAPIWTGCLWPNAAELPKKAPKPTPFASITLQLTGGVHLVVSDNPSEGITLGTVDGARIQISQTGISLDNGKGATITLSGTSVDINKGALRVT